MEVSQFLIAVLIFGIIIIFKGVKIVPQQQAWVVERLGKFSTLLEPGLNLIIPFLDKVAYKHSLKEDAISVNSQAAITRDNVTLTLDGVIFVKIIDPKLASYGVADPYFAVTQLAQTTMRSEIGKMDLDKTFEEREKLNVNIVNALNEASATWGIQCMRYEIKDIEPPKSILIAMEQQVTADRTKRALILESEGKKQFQINIAEAQKQEVVLQSEASKIDQINRAEGEANAILSVAAATAESIEKVASSIQKTGGEKAVALRVAEQYVAAFSELAKKGNTIIVPANAADAGGMVAQALAVFDNIKNRSNSNDSAAGSKPNPWNA
jgi:regulator of protease activity HflC (stomatin/prohibitin superfamily)